MNAVLDAVAHPGIRHLDMPLTPLAMWRALRGGEVTHLVPAGPGIKACILYQ